MATIKEGIRHWTELERFVVSCKPAARKIQRLWKSYKDRKDMLLRIEMLPEGLRQAMWVWFMRGIVC